MRLLRAILLRLLYGVLSLVFISFVTFIAGEMTPGDAAQIAAGEKASPAAVQALRVKMGLDRPWPARYVSYIAGAAHLEFGNSYRGMQRPVGEIIAERTVPTAKIAFLAIILASFIGIILGTIAGVYRNKAPDVGILTFSTLGVTVPNFVLLPILIYIFANQLDQLPGDWPHAPNVPEFYYLILPVCVLAARPAALLTRLTRASIIDTLQQEFIRTATAKGVPPMRLIFRHALRNAILPVITAIGTTFGFLLTGSFTVEYIYRIQGLGSTAIEAILKRDYPVIQATVLVTGVMFILVNLVIDLLLPVLDPRIREAQV